MRCTMLSTRKRKSNNKTNFKMKKFFLLLTAVLVNCLTGGLFAAVVGAAPAVGAVAMNVVAMIPNLAPMGVLRGTVYTEVWIGEVVKQFTDAENDAFLMGIPDYSQFAKNDVLHLVDAGVNPDVLINNTTYPIEVQSLSDTDIAISLDKYQTKATPITDDELYACSYDKIKLRKEQHGDSIAENKHNKAIHAFAPVSNTKETPVLTTTGEVTEDGRRRLTTKDLIEAKRKLDLLKVPKKGRRLVLCSDHVADLLLQDQKFFDQFYNYTTGKIANLYGFEVYEYSSNPIYSAAGAKKSFGAVANTGEFEASVIFYVKNMFKAKGDTTMYYSEAKNDPQNQRNLLNFRHYFVAMPKVTRGTCAIMSAYQAG